MTSAVPAPSPSPKPIAKLLAKAPAAAEADVIPEDITVKHTRKVTMWMPKALCAYSAAPAACGYFVTSSRYEHAVMVATTKATRNGSHAAPPTSAATWPVRA